MNPETTERLAAIHPNHVWAIDFQFDETSDGRRLKLANIVDEHTREALAMIPSGGGSTVWNCHQLHVPGVGQAGPETMGSAAGLGG